MKINLRKIADDDTFTMSYEFSISTRITLAVTEELAGSFDTEIVESGAKALRDRLRRELDEKAIVTLEK